MLQAILVAVLGGVDPAGGSGTVSGAVLAVLCLQFLSTGSNMLLAEVPGGNFARECAWGALLLAVMAANAFAGRWRGRPRRDARH